MSFLLEKKGSDLQPSMFNYQKVPFAKFQTAAQVEESPYFLYRWWDSHQVWKTTPLTPLKPPSFWVYPPFDQPSNCLLNMSSNSRIVPQNPDSSLKKATTKTLFHPEGQCPIQKDDMAPFTMSNLWRSWTKSWTLHDLSPRFLRWSYASNHYHLPH